MQSAQANVTGKKPLGASRKALLVPLSPSEFGLTKAAYTIPETLLIVPFGRTKLYAYIAAGDLPLLKFGRRASITGHDIAALLNRLRMENAEQEDA